MQTIHLTVKSIIKHYLVNGSTVYKETCCVFLSQERSLFCGVSMEFVKQPNQHVRLQFSRAVLYIGGEASVGALLFGPGAAVNLISFSTG
jgi:hypothetical protein